MDAIKGANRALAFILELGALAALGYWGFRTSGGAAAKWALGIGAPLTAAMVWGLFVAPRAAVTVPGPVRLMLKAMVFGSATLACMQRTATGLPSRSR